MNIFHDKHRIYVHVNVVEIFVIQLKSLVNGGVMRNQNGQKYFSQVFHNMINMGNMMNCTAKFITNSNQI